jgi:mRNA interferase MazF
VVKYIPQQGDIVALSFDPQSGHEQKGRRPAIIISNKIFNKHLGLAFACPITNSKRNSPFHIEIDSENITGFIMGEQMKSIDYNSRNIKFIEKINQKTMNKLLGIIDSIIQ